MLETRGALRGLRPIAIEVDCESVSVGIQKATRIGLIVNELVTNSLKHAFPGEAAGTIRVQVRRTNDNLTLTVDDNGNGCPQQPQTGLGTRLVNLLVQQLGGKIQRDPGNPGCIVTVTIPPSRYAA